MESTEPKPGAFMVQVRPSSMHKIGIFNKDIEYEFRVYEWRKPHDPSHIEEYDWRTYYADYLDPVFRDHIKGEKRATELGIARLKRAVADRDGAISLEEFQKKNFKNFYEEDVL